MAKTLDWTLERYRALLHLQVRLLQLDPRFQRRFDSSDLVQETLLKAHTNRAGFRGATEADLVKWLQEILKNVVTDQVRRATADKRDLWVEEPLRAAVADSSARLLEYLADKQSSPSAHVAHQELLLRLAAAIEQLPEDQRDVVLQRDLGGASIGQIATRLGRTEKSVAGLLLRGRRRLRELLEDYQ